MPPLNSLQYQQELAWFASKTLTLPILRKIWKSSKNALCQELQFPPLPTSKSHWWNRQGHQTHGGSQTLPTPPAKNQLRLANNKLDDVSVKKLTRNNPTMKAKFGGVEGVRKFCFLRFQNEKGGFIKNLRIKVWYYILMVITARDFHFLSTNWLVKCGLKSVNLKCLRFLMQEMMSLYKRICIKSITFKVWTWWTMEKWQLFLDINMSI